SEEDEPQPAAKKKAAKAKPTWEQVMAKHAKKQPKAYQLGEYFKEMEVLSHPKFGVGFVTENIGDDKIEVTFKDDKRVLVHNRKGLTLPFMRPVAQPKGKKGKALPVPSANGGGKKGAPKAVAPAKAQPPKAQAKPHKAAAKPVAKKPAPKPKAAARAAAKKPAKTAAKKVKRGR
ncbi:MAG TPA: hypothetical protein VF997_17145, partial [Polyangia bacterium]